MAEHNDYSDIVQQFANPEPARPNVQTGLALAADANPDYEAELRKIAAKTGVPIDTARNMEKDVRRQAFLADANPRLLESQYPKVAAFLADPDNAALAKDDIGTLQRVSNLWASFTTGISRGSIQEQLGPLHYRAMIGDLSPSEERQRQELKKVMEAYGRDAERETGFGYFLNATGYTGRQLVSSVTEGGKGAVAGAAVGATAAAVAGQLGPQVALPEELVTVPGAAAIGARLGYVGASVVYNYKQEAGFAFDEFSDMKDAAGKTLDRSTAQGAAAAVGLINAGLETIGDLALAKLVPGLDKLLSQGGKGAVKALLTRPTFRQAIARAGGKWIKAATAEGVTEALQELTAIIGGELAQGVDDLTAVNQQPAGERIMQAGRDAFVGALGVGLPGASYQGYRGARQAHAAQQNQEFMTALGEAATESKLAKRMPEKWREFIAKAKEGGPVENVYIPAEQFATYFQSAGVDPAEVALEIGAKNYSEALAAGTDIVIPLEDYATHIAPTEHHARLMQDVRLHQGEMTPREFAAFEAEREQRMKEMADSIALDQETDSPAFNQIKEDIVGQLLGTYDRSSAEAMATVFAKGMTTLAQRAGVDPMELYRRYGLTVGKPLPDILKPGDASDITIDPLLDRLRAGDIPSELQVFGEPLTEFVRRMGGIKDDGGDVRAMDADKGLRPFQKKMIQPETGRAVDDMRLLAAEHGFVPEDISEADFLSLLDDEIQGIAQTFADRNQDQQLLSLREQLQAIDEALNHFGIDLNTLTNEQVRQALAVGTQALSEMAGQYGQSLPETIEVDGVMRPTRNSEGKPISYTTGALRDFWRWFGDSKVVDEQGRPLVVYHGSKVADIDVFRTDGIGRLGQGAYFSADRTLADSFAGDGGSIYAAYLRIENPMTQEDGFKKLGYEMDSREKGVKSLVGRLMKKLADTAFDGVVFEGYQDRKNSEFVVFKPEQIKSVDNIGTWSRTDVRIMYQSSPATDTDAFKKWFGGSKVVDHDGKPLIVYHGTKEDIGKFSKRKSRTNGGFFFAADPAFASSPAYTGYVGGSAKGGGNVLPVFLSIKNPKTIKSLSFNPMAESAAIEQAKTEGHDGIYVSDHYYWIAFEPKQIKSAIGNIGTWNPNDARIMYQGGETKSVLAQTETEAFKRWSNDAPLVTSADATVDRFRTGEKVVVEAFHGTKRPDRVGTKFLKKRATSGPMAYFTSSPALASNYAMSKGDTSLVNEDQDYANWFKVKVPGGRSKVDIARAWYFLPPDVKQTIRERMPDIRMDDDGNVIYEEGGGDLGSYDWELQQTRTAYDRGGNPLKAAVESWLNSGALFNDEEQFMRVLELAGMPKGMVEFDSPHAEWSAVYKVFVAMQKPLVTSDIPQEVIDALKDAAKKDRSRAKYQNGADPWDKNTRTLREWVAEFTDPNNGSASYVWTSIPDKVTDVFRSLGYDGIIDSSGKAGGDVHPVYIPFEETQVKSALGNSGKFDPTKNDILKQDKRGFITFGTDRKFSITLLEKADLSTFLHETGHFWLEVMGDLAESSPAMAADYATLLNWFGVKSRDEIKVEHHEQFARAFEGYLMEGRAPSVELRGIFRQFRAWLKDVVYRLIRLDYTLNDDIRGIFDRLIATDEEIEVARRDMGLTQMFATAADMGVTEAEFEAYAKATRDEIEEGREALQAKLITEFERRNKEWFKEQRARIEAEVRAETEQQPVYLAFNALVSGNLADGSMPGLKLNKDELVERYGAEYLKRLPRGFQRIYTTDGGVSTDLAADLFGFASPDAMVEALVNMRPMKAVIQAETDARLNEQLGNMLRDGSLYSEAVAALHNDKRADVLQAELRALRRKERQVKPIIAAMNREDAQARAAMQDSIPPVSAFRDMAAGMIGQKNVRDLQPGMYLNAERKASREAFDAAARGDYQAAAAAKQRELMNHFLFREATKAQDEIDAIVKHARDLEKSAAQQRIGKAGADYLEQINALLDRYEFRKVSGRQLDRRASMLAWYNSQVEAGFSPAIDQKLLEDASQKNYRDVPVDELRAVRDAIASIEHLARLKNKLLGKNDQIEFDDAIGNLIAAAEQNTGGARKRSIDPALRTVRERFMDTLEKFDAELLPMETVIDMLDGGPSGPWHDFIFNRASDAQAAELDVMARLGDSLGKLLERYDGKAGTSLLDKFETPVGTVSRNYLISVALNVGNQQNYDKLLRGMGWTAAQVDGMLKHLSAEDVAFVQAAWDEVNALWPQIAALEKRISGVEPEKVEARPFQIRDDAGNALHELRGGYYPLVYDPRHSQAGLKQESGPLAGLTEKGYAYAVTPKGHTKGRTEFAAPLQLDFAYVLQKHLSGVVKDLTHREFLIDANRIFNDQRIRTALQQQLGDAYEGMMMPWLKAIANDRVSSPADGLTGIDRFIEGARSHTTTVTLGFKVTTIMAQAAGAMNAIEYVGARWFREGFMQATKNPAEAYRTVVAKSGEMRHRFQTIDRDIRDELRSMRDGQVATWRAKINEAAFIGINIADRMVTIPTWLGAYEKARAANLTEEQSIHAADAAVRRSQGAGAAKDLNALQRRRGAMKMLTMFYTPFAAAYGRVRTAGAKTRVEGARYAPTAIMKVMLVTAFPAIIADLLTARGPSECAADDPACFAKWAAFKSLGGVTAVVPGVREVGNAFENFATGKNSPRDIRISPVIDMFQKLWDTAVKGGKIAFTDQEADSDFWFDLMENSGYVLNLPTAQARITIEYLYDLLAGKSAPEGPGDFLHDMAFRRKENK